MIYPKLIVVAAVIFVVFVAYVVIVCSAILYLHYDYQEPIKTKPIEPPQGAIVIQGSSFIAVSALYYPIPITHGVLIDCLIQKESSGNPRAYNEFDPTTESIGILQFKRATYQHFCIDKYGLPDDIWSEENQRSCCELMLRDDLGHHWTTMKFCK